MRGWSWRLEWCLVCFFAVPLLLVPSVSAQALDSQADTITVSASVMPARYIIIDKDQVIQQIISNCACDVAPKVLFGDSGGKEVGYSSKISAQFKQIELANKLDKSGVVYSRPTGFRANLLHFSKQLRPLAFF